jgi:hypothetical protein
MKGMKNKRVGSTRLTGWGGRKGNFDRRDIRNGRGGST